MPRIIADLDTLAIRSTGLLPPSDADAIGNRQGLRARLFSSYRLEVGFSRTSSNDALVNMGEDIGLEFLLKRSTGTQKYDEAVLVSAVAFVREAEGTNYIYADAIDLGAPVLQKLLGVDHIAQKESLTIETVADVADSLVGKYFDIYHGTGATDFYRFYFAGAVPADGGGTLIEVDLTTNDSAATVAANIASAINDDTGGTYTASAVDDVVTTVREAFVRVGYHHPRSSGCTITTTAAGMAGGAVTDEEEVTLIGEVSFEQDGERQILELVTFTVENTLRRPGVTNPGAASGSNVRRGSVALGNGVSFKDVVFATALSDASWTFRDLRVVNTVDATPLNLWAGIVTARSATGFTVELNGATDSTNYLLEYTCER